MVSKQCVPSEVVLIQIKSKHNAEMPRLGKNTSDRVKTELRCNVGIYQHHISTHKQGSIDFVTTYIGKPVAGKMLMRLAAEAET
jgi:hypothetical protein